MCQGTALLGGRLAETSRAPARCCLRWRFAPAAQAKKVCILGVRLARPKLCISVARPVTVGAHSAFCWCCSKRVEGYGITLRRAPEVRQACLRAQGPGYGC